MLELNSNLTALSVSIFFLVSTAVYAVLQMPGIDPYRKALRFRLKNIGDSAANDIRNPQSNLLQTNAPVSNWGSFFQGGTDVPTMLARAGFYGPASFKWYCVGSAICMSSIAVIGAAILTAFPKFLSLNSLVILFCVAASGWFAPRVWLGRAVEKRHRMLRKSIPDLFELMIVCFDAGLSLPYTLKRVAAELQLAHPQLASELLRVQHDTEMGASIELALNNFAQRSNFDGLKSLCILVREANRFGSDITQALKDHADLLRLQREMAAEEMAQKASVKIIFPILLFILPAVFVVVAGPAFIQLSIAFAKGLR